MKKIITTLLTILICFSLVACTKSEEIKNGVVEYNSLEEINEITGMHIVVPAVMGIEDVKYCVIENKIAMCTFVINGYSYFIKATYDVDCDASGIYIEGTPAFDIEEVKQNEKCFAQDELYKLFSFMINNGQYIFAVNDNGELSYDEFESEYYEIRDMIIKESTNEQFRNIEGMYVDSTSQRATAEVILTDANKCEIYISWSNSANENDTWTIVGNIEDDGKIKYDTDYHVKRSFDEDGNQLSETLTDTSNGYILYKDNKLIWSGSNNPQTSTCVFEKAQ